MKRLKRDTPRRGSLDLYAYLDSRTTGGESLIDDPVRIQAGMAAFKDGLQEAFQSASLIYGTFAEAVFESVVATLGATELLKSEDTGAGVLYTGEKPKLPDYRLITKVGETWLVEVKSTRVRGPGAAFRMSAGERKGLRRYAALTLIVR